jgi:hypothetical protein
MFWDNVSVPSSRVKQSKKNDGNIWVRSYIGNGVGGDLFSENMMLTNRVVEREGQGEKKEVKLSRGRFTSEHP